MKNNLLYLLLIISTVSIAQPSCPWAYIPSGLSATYQTELNTVVDNNGDIVQVGKILGSADMDPGTGVGDTSFSSPGYNYYLSKTNVNGALAWIRYFKSPAAMSFFQTISLKINASNEIVVGGNFYGVVDFDLSDSGVDTLRSHFPTYPDYFVAKYDPFGNYQWAINIGDPTTSNIELRALCLLPNDDILVSANPSGTVDVDPGPAIHNSMGGNANIVCYNSAGNYLWNNHSAVTFTYGITSQSLATDAAGNSYLLSVGYYELTVDKFNNAGALQWSRTIGDFSSGGRLTPQSVLVDAASGSFYVAGTYDGTVDFDPGVPTVNRTCTGFNYEDGFIAKYDANMDLLWVNTYAGRVAFGNYSLAFNGADVVAVGQLMDNIDFGNGIIFSSPSFLSPFYVKLNTAGMAQSGFMIPVAGKFNTIGTTNASTKFVISGYISGTADMDPSTSSLMLSCSTSNFFTAVYQSSPNGISDLVEKPAYMYPNPAKDVVYLDIPTGETNQTLTISDLAGRPVITQNVSARQGVLAVNVSALSNGVYTYSLSNGEVAIFAGKLIIEK